MFDLNEAPNLVLSKISREKTARNCGTFWAVLCCLPTFGASIGLGTPQNDDYACCYPHPVSIKSNAGLRTLIDALNSIRITRATLPEEYKKGITQSEANQLIEWQVKQTINVLEKVISEHFIEGSYNTALSEVLMRLRLVRFKKKNFHSCWRVKKHH